MPTSRNRPGTVPFRPSPQPGIVIDRDALEGAKAIAARLGGPNTTGRVISACIRYTLTMAGAQNAIFPFAAALNPMPEGAPAPMDNVVADPDAPEPEAEEQDDRSAEERLAALREIGGDAAAKIVEEHRKDPSERETPVVETPVAK